MRRHLSCAQNGHKKILCKNKLTKDLQKPVQHIIREHIILVSYNVPQSVDTLRRRDFQKVNCR